MKDQRKLERFDLRVRATIEVVSEHQNLQKKILYAMTKNICAGGAFFNTKNLHLPKGTQVKMGLVLNVGRLKGLEGRRALVRVGGMVLRSEQAGMAARFYESYKIVPLKKV